MNRQYVEVIVTLVPADHLHLNILMNKTSAITNSERTTCHVICYSSRVWFVSPNFSGQKVRHLRTASHLCSVCGLQDSLSNLNLWSLNTENNRGVIFRRWLFPSCCSPLVLVYTGVWGWLVLSESPFFIAVDSTDRGRSHMLGNVQLCTKWFVIVDDRSQDQGLLLGGKKSKNTHNKIYHTK